MRGPGRPVLRCLAARARRVSEDWGACDRHELEPDCLDCTACCGPAFHVVELGRRESQRPSLAAWVVMQEGRPTLPRGAEGLCPALDPGSGCCSVYADRPDSCRDFEKGSANCLWARRRAGLSRSFGAQGS
jgi:Fe-S-cluster containining protein